MKVMDLISFFSIWYDISMKSNTNKKSSFTLSATEVPLVTRLRRRLKLQSNTEVIRQALYLLESQISRDELRRQFHEASLLVRNSSAKERKDMDQLVGETLR